MNNQDFTYINKIQISGNIGSDLEIKEGQSGSQYGILSFAQNSKTKDESGNEQNTAHWYSAFLWNEAFEAWKDKITAGARVEINGRLTVDNEGKIFIAVNNPKGLKVTLTGKMPDDSRAAVEQPAMAEN